MHNHAEGGSFTFSTALSTPGYRNICVRRCVNAPLKNRTALIVCDAVLVLYAASTPGYRNKRIRSSVNAPLKIRSIDRWDILVLEYLAEAGIGGSGVLRIANEVYKLCH